ncbi:pentapeptide repeat-containing protein [Dactylosporangium sp. NBC_01737]|uniref:pentapeptide repeat-containing protein n=1 Tax=Dactylosporangium sp. NBC_01737 TaxID=2975959 RepID=UPI002E146DF2|nr:pentapeptide repeat-containing protein [Dactylosporangium sp. NBC_01737]
MDHRGRLHAARRALVGLVVVVVVLGALAGVVYILPAHIAPRAAFGGADDAIRAQNDVRGTLLQALAGLVLAIGAYVTWRQLLISRDQLRHNLRSTTDQLKATQDQLAVAAQGQITERFTRATDQLGNGQIVVRLGGIYALERMAKDSPADATTIAEILASYIRQHAPLPGDRDASSGQQPDVLDVPLLVTRAADVQAALTVLARNGIRPEAEPLRLLGVDLRRADLAEANLIGADLEGTRLGRAWMRGAQLDGADLTSTDLREADLADASLEGADLTEALLQGTNLAGASLRGATLDTAHLTGALADETTIWPTGLDPRAAGVVFGNSAG